MKLSDLEKKGIPFQIGSQSAMSGQSSVAPNQAQPGIIARGSVAARNTGDNLIIGALKGAGSTLTGIDTLVRKVPGVATTLDVISPKKGGLAQDREFVKPKGIAQNIGFGAEQIAEFVAPGNIASKGIKTYQAATAASKLPKAVKVAADLGARIAIDGTATAAVRTAQTGNPGQGIKEGVVAGVASAGTRYLFSGLKQLARVQPKVAAFLTGVDDKVFSRQMNDPAAAKAALQQAKTEGVEGVLSRVQSSVRATRKILTNSYEKGSQSLVDAYQGTRVGFSARETSLLNKLSSFYPTLEGAVQNPQKFSLKEGLNLYKQINEVVGHGSSPEEVTARSVRDIVRKKLVSNFDTREGASISKFLHDYATTKEAHDAIDSLAAAYRTGEPKAQAAAQSAIQRVFNKNQTAYLSAFEDFARETGFDHTDLIAALSARQVLPITSLKSGGDAAVSLARMLLTPLGSSPRASAFISRMLGNAMNGTGAPGAAVRTVERAAPYVIGTKLGD
jgi:hypothetical protein